MRRYRFNLHNRIIAYRPHYLPVAAGKRHALEKSTPHKSPHNNSSFNNKLYFHATRLRPATNHYLRILYVHTFINSEKGNITQIDKPIFPVMINSSQIQVGENWTITCPLQAYHNYHVYIYGAWVNTSSTAKTDYDIDVYDPSGNLESSHTEAAGFPEHLGSANDDSIFTPKQSGNYSFLIKNDARESAGAQQATFMIIENLECDQWYTSSVEGKGDDSQCSMRTSWAYEFVTNESTLEVHLRIPQTLDMYG